VAEVLPFVVDPRRTHWHRPGRSRDLPGLVEAVADHQSTPGLVDLMGERVDVRGDLGLQRRGQHRPRAVTDQLVKQRSADRSRCVLVGLGLFLDYLEHGRAFPNQRANAGS